MSKVPDILAKIIDHKQQEIIKRQQQISEAALNAAITHTPYNFVQALQQCRLQQRPAIIAEIKKASPSKGIIRADFNPEKIALEYVAGGATCISVLTDEKFFQGSNQDLVQVRNCCKLPLLRKDFIIDPYQIYEARAMGADCILLIVAALNDQQLHELHDLAIELQLQVLVESHTLTELERALTLSTPLIGINNRNLHTFETNLQTTIDLQSIIPSDRLIITESGINNIDDIKLMQQHGINCFLIGEVLMRDPYPQQKLSELC